MSQEWQRTWHITFPSSIACLMAECVISGCSISKHLRTFARKLGQRLFLSCSISIGKQLALGPTGGRFTFPATQTLSQVIQNPSVVSHSTEKMRELRLML